MLDQAKNQNLQRNIVSTNEEVHGIEVSLLIVMGFMFMKKPLPPFPKIAHNIQSPTFERRDSFLNVCYSNRLSNLGET